MRNSDSDFLSAALGAAGEGFNPSPVFEDVNLFASDRALADAAAREGASWARDELNEIGRIAGSAHVLDLGQLANENPPKPRVVDQKGRRRDRVEFHLASRTLHEGDARWLAERLALLAAACLLTAHAPAEIAEPFAASRLGGGWRHSYGAGLKGADTQAIVARAGEGL